MNGRRAVWLGLFASAIFLGAFAYLFLPREDIGRVFTDANLWYVLPSLVLYFAAVWFRARRWNYLLKPLIGRPRRALYPVVVAGYMANNILPVRLGELVRSYYLGLRERTSSTAAFGTVVVERAADVLVLLFFIAIAWVALPSAGLLDRLAVDVPGGTTVLIAASLAPFMVIGAIVVTITAMPRSMTLAGMERFVGLWPFPEKIKSRLKTAMARLVDGLTVVRTPGAFATLFGASLPVWVLEGAMYLVIAYGFGLDRALGGFGELVAAVMLFTAIANLALIVPSASGGIGPFEFFGAATMVALGAPEGTAALYALTVHVALLLPVTALGFALILADGLSFRALVSRSLGGTAGQPLPEESAGPAGGATG
ncbi:MAG: flippase-like domain-containing protein [Chloroflexi bacterium]|nr:flippase-like domain-containing protein [Chloroflexota bacterium]